MYIYKFINYFPKKNDTFVLKNNVTSYSPPKSTTFGYLRLSIGFINRCDHVKR